MKKNRSLPRNMLAGIAKRKLLTSIIAITCIVGGYGIYTSAVTANAEPQYTLTPVKIGSITETVTGSGQVSASNQTDIQSQVSGTIQSIDVSVGQKVVKGQVIARIDSSNAAITLRNAELSYQKLLQPAKASELQNAVNSLTKSYNDGFTAATNIYLDMPTIVSGMKDLLYGSSGFLSDQKATYLSPTGRTYRDNAAIQFDKAKNRYEAALIEFKATTRDSSTSTLDTLMRDTYDSINLMSQAVLSAQNAVNFITTSQPEYNSSLASSVSTNIGTWANTSNSDLSSLSSAQNSIASANNSLTDLKTGSDALDIESSRLSLLQAQKTYDNYTIRAPYDGTIGKIPVNIYGQAGASTVIATIIGNQKIATISLNEVDAAKVSDGQKVNITFDAIDGLNATGTVSQVDQVGSVSSGVVSYGVKISINTEDARIKPGMSVNTTIITKEKNDVLTIPSSAIKTLNGKSYVQTFDTSVMSANRQTTASTTARSSQFSGQYFASSTRPFMATANKTFTISTSESPKTSFITIGDTDGTNSEIIDGLKNGDLVVTKVVLNGTSVTTQSNRSILNVLSGRKTSSSGTTRTQSTNVRVNAGGPPAI